MGFKNADWDLLKYTHGQTSATTFVENRGNCCLWWDRLLWYRSAILCRIIHEQLTETCLEVNIWIMLRVFKAKLSVFVVSVAVLTPSVTQTLILSVSTSSDSFQSSMQIPLMSLCYCKCLTKSLCGMNVEEVKPKPNTNIWGGRLIWVGDVTIQKTINTSTEVTENPLL